MFDQLMELFERDNRAGEKKRGGLRGMFERLGGDADETYAESTRGNQRRDHDDEYDEDYQSSRRRERDGFDFD